MKPARLLFIALLMLATPATGAWQVYSWVPRYVVAIRLLGEDSVLLWRKEKLT